MKIKLLSVYKKKSVNERVQIVATAGKLSRFPGTVTQVYKSSTDYEKNKRFIERVIEMGHDSITDHDYLVFSLENVSPIVEQTLIEERFSSFTIKSRREVNFANVGYYKPVFKDNNGTILKNNSELLKKYNKHMKFLFKSYEELLELGISKEDSRFILPYSFNSNIIMGIDAHVFRNLIVKLTKGKLSNIDELKELGNKFYEIMENYVPYLKGTIEKEEVNNYDRVEELLSDYGFDNNYKIIDRVKLLSYTKNIDEVIILSSLMRVYGYEYEKAFEIYNNKIKNNDKLINNLFKEIVKTKDKLEFKQINFRFQIPISLAVLTHITRHRTHSLMVPDFVPIRNLMYYKTPKSINDLCKDKFDNIFKKNFDIYNEFKSFGVRDEDLIYFYLAGNMLNVETNMDGGTLAHILKLRTCNKAQWEIRFIANEMRKQVREVSKYYGNVLGPDCEVFKICNEGKESCGKIDLIKRGEA